MVKFMGQMYEEGSDVWVSFQETKETQIMSYPLSALAECHELWKKALGKCNAKKYHDDQAMEKARADSLKGNQVVHDLSDIDQYHHQNGHGTHMLEYDFSPDTPARVQYISRKTGMSGSYWNWTHKYTKVSVRCSKILLCIG